MPEAIPVEPTPHGPLGSARPRRPAWSRWGLRILIAVVLYTVVGFWLVPLLARSIAVSQLRKALDREVSIAKLTFNPFSFATEVRGLAIQDLDGSLLAAWDLVRVNFQFTSIFRGPWRVAEVIVVRPTFRVQLNPDYTLNFSDLFEKFSNTDPPPKPPEEPQPLPRILIESLRIEGVTVDYTDLTPSSPFRRILGPATVVTTNFSTEPGRTNTLTLVATTDAGENITWNSRLLLDPPRLIGTVALADLHLTNYTALYQDFLSVQVRGGTVSLSTDYDFRFGSSNQLAQLSDSRFALDGLKIGLPEAATNLMELDELAVRASAVDVWQRIADVDQVLVQGLRLSVHRLPDRRIEIVEAARPPPTAARAPASALFLLKTATNVFAMFSGSTNAARAVLTDVLLTNAAVTWFDESPSEPVQATISDLQVRVRNLSNLSDATPTATLALKWQSDGTVEVKANAAVDPPAATIELSLSELDLSTINPYLEPHLHLDLLAGRLSVQGQASLEVPPAQQPQARFEGQLALTHFDTAHGADQSDLVKWDAIRFDGVAIDLHPLEASVDRVEWSGLEIWAILNTNGTLNLLTAAKVDQPLVTAPGAPEDVPPDSAPSSAPAPQAEPPSPAPAEASPLPPAHIAAFVLTNATLHLLDRMADPNAHLTIAGLHGEARGLSTTNLQHAEFDLDGSIESGGSFDLQGQLRPLDGAEATIALVTMTGIDLTPGSPYTSRFLGYRLDRGKLNAELSYRIASGQLDATNHLVLDHFTLGQKTDSPDALNLPIKLGLAVLQDRQGRIDLTVPVSGSISDPQFSFASAISGAFGNIFSKIITSPFSILGGMFGGQEDDLKELEFEPGLATLSNGSQKRIAKLEEILYERPGLEVKITGGANPQDDAPTLRRDRLAAKLREAWRQSLPPEADPETNASTEPPAFGDSLYKAAVETAYLASTGTPNPPDALSPEPESEPPATTETAEPPSASDSTPTDSRLRPRRILRGGEIMIRNRSTAEPVAAPVAEPESTVTPAPEQDPEPTAPATTPLPTFEEMEQHLLDGIEVTDQDYRHLATERANTAKDLLLQSGRVEADHLMVSEAEGLPPEERKVTFELQ